MTKNKVKFNPIQEFLAEELEKPAIGIAKYEQFVFDTNVSAVHCLHAETFKSRLRSESDEEA